MYLSFRKTSKTTLMLILNIFHSNKTNNLEVTFWKTVTIDIVMALAYCLFYLYKVMYCCNLNYITFHLGFLLTLFNSFISIAGEIEFKKEMIIRKIQIFLKKISFYIFCYVEYATLHHVQVCEKCSTWILF